MFADWAPSSRPTSSADGGEDALRLRLAGDERRDAPQRGLLGRERAQLGVGAPALGDVAQVAREQRRALDLRPRDRDLDREDAAVRAHAREVERVVERAALARLEVPPQAAAVRLAQVVRDDQVGEVAPHHLGRRGSRRCARWRG